jgi:NAD(P)-dependent dehydrogenase (short-subunit alcohol dehydrogenase family)
MRLEGKVALVTGFGSGLGRAIAVRFAKEGAKIVGLSRGTKAGEETLKQIHDAGGEAIFVSTDVRSEAEVLAAVAKGVSAFGGIDITVNSTGIRLTGTAPQTSKEDWDAVIGTNLTGTFLVSRAAIPEMRKRGGGCIINISAISGIHGQPGRVAYSASKGGVVNLTEAMALDHGAEHIRVNCICPGPTETPMTIVRSPEQRAQMDKRVPIGHIGQPEDVAEAALYLASDAARQVTGAILAVDGGLHLAP